VKDVDYASGKTPPEYVCSGCGATGCKLWREYQTMCTDLKCAACSLAEQSKTGTVGDDGKLADEHGRSDQIGWRIPAVPDEEGVGYWGYTSVPQDGCTWWRNLPTHPEVAP